MTDLPSLKIAYTSRRPYADGPVTAPFPENDPANIAYLLHGDYYSFLTLKRMSQPQLRKKLEPYDLVFVALDHRALDIVVHIAAACAGRLVTYSEGNIADYQMHSPTGQALFLQIINQARANFLYWEKYQSFYRSLTERPVHYLPYPYFYEVAQAYAIPISERRMHVTLPSGLAGNTRNGLASLSVAKLLLKQEHIQQINCWLTAATFAEDAQTIEFFVLGTPPPKRQLRFSWRQWLQKSGIDYRSMLKFKKKVLSPKSVPLPLINRNGLALYRRRTWLHYLPEMAKTMLVIDLNNRETVGRNAQDCAAVGVPCISTHCSDLQYRLFPETTLEDSWNVDQAVLLSQKLLQDEDFYKATIEYAATALTTYGEEGFCRRFAEALMQYPELVRSGSDGTNSL